MPKCKRHIQGDTHAPHFLQDFAIGPHEAFVVATTDRTVMDFDKFGEYICLCCSKSKRYTAANVGKEKSNIHFKLGFQAGIYSTN